MNRFETGFLKRAVDCGVDEQAAREMLKQTSGIGASVSKGMKLKD